jgi:superfamily II DNA or RNA helicase
VVAPKGLATQWVAEMETHFNETFQLVMGEDIGTLQRLSRSANRPTSAWTMFDQVIVSLDSVKPMEKRRGWTDERLAAYNRSRFEDLISAGWDLVVVDEAHRLGGSTDQVARYRLGLDQEGQAGAAQQRKQDEDEGADVDLHRTSWVDVLNAEQLRVSR